jgi:hypothetical protein
MSVPKTAKMMIGTFSSIMVFKSIDNAPAKSKKFNIMSRRTSLNSNSSMICSAPWAMPGNKIPTKRTKAELIKAISMSPMVDGNLKYAMLIRVKAAERTSNNVIKSIILIEGSSKDKIGSLKGEK